MKADGQTIVQPRVIATVDLDRISRNLEAVTRLASRGRGARGGRFGAVPMVKSNAYGHGIMEVARALARARDTTAIGVATLDEAVALREGGVRAPIWVFSDCAPWNDTIASIVRRFGLTPVIHTLEDLRRILAGGARRAPAFHLKFNTGMNRLGIDWTEVSRVRAVLARARARPEGLCTHFAMGERPGSVLTRRQAARFRAIAAELADLEVSHIHSSNTAAALAVGRGELPALEGLCTVIRPGLGIYGYSDLPCGELQPALKLRARVLAARALKKNEPVGYGATFRASRACRGVALSLGYGDGLPRALSNRELLIGGRGRRVLGRVSMDLTLLELSAKPGGWVTLLGEGRAQGERMAREAGTIVYELLTAISQRVPRLYEGG